MKISILFYIKFLNINIKFTSTIFFFIFNKFIYYDGIMMSDSRTYRNMDENVDRI